MAEEQPHPQASAENGPAKKRKKKPRRKTLDNYERSIARSTVAIAAFTIVLAGVAIGQLAAFMWAERAFLSIERIEFRKLDLKEPNHIVLDIRNSGRATAEITNLVLERTEILPPPLRYPPGGITPSPVPSGGKLTIYSAAGPSDPIQLTEAEIEGINQHSIHFYIYGYIQYVGGFTFPFGQMVTGFCFVYEPQISGFSACAEKNYTYAERIWAGERKALQTTAQPGAQGQMPNITQSATPAIMPLDK